MVISKTTKTKVLFGNELHNSPPESSTVNSPVVLTGLDCDGNNATIPLDAGLLSKHMMFMGGIGTGKTNTLYQIVSQLKKNMTPDDVMIIFDTKGDFYKEFYTKGDIVISNDETATGANELDYWNIFNEIEKNDHLVENVVELSKSIFAEACEKTNQVFFPNAAKDLFMATLLHFFRRIDPIHRTNENLKTFLFSTSSEEFRAMLNMYPDLRSMVSYISHDESAQTQGVLSELQQVVREILIGNFAKTGTLSLRNIVREKGGKTAFIEYDLSSGSMLTPVYTLMFDMAIKEALGRKRSQGNVYFITDEFRLLPNLQHIDDAVNFGRSMGIKFIIGIQNVEQIYDNYGEQRARSILSGFSTSVIFRLADKESREYAKGIFGQNRKLDAYMPIMQSKGLVEEQRDGFVVEDWDIANLQIGQAVVGLPGQEPFVFAFDEYLSRNR